MEQKANVDNISQLCENLVKVTACTAVRDHAMFLSGIHSSITGVLTDAITKLEKDLCYLKEFSTTREQFLQWLKENQLLLESNKIPYGDRNSLEGKLRNLKHITASLPNGQQLLNAVCDSRTEILNVLTESSKIDMRRQIEEMKHDFSSLHDSTCEAIDVLSSVLTGLQEFAQSSTKVKKWIDTIETILKDTPVTKGDIVEIRTKLEYYKDLLKEIHDYQCVIDDVKSKGNVLVDIYKDQSPKLEDQIKQQLTDIQESYDSLLLSTQNIQAQLEEALQRFNRYEKCLQSCERLVNEAGPTFKRTEKGLSHYSVKNAKEKLDNYKKILGRLTDMKDQLRNAVQGCVEAITSINCPSSPDVGFSSTLVEKERQIKIQLEGLIEQNYFDVIRKLSLTIVACFSVVDIMIKKLGEYHAIANIPIKEFSSSLFRENYEKELKNLLNIRNNLLENFGSLFVDVAEIDEEDGDLHCPNLLKLIQNIESFLPQMQELFQDTSNFKTWQQNMVGIIKSLLQMVNEEKISFSKLQEIEKGFKTLGNEFREMSMKALNLEQLESTHKQITSDEETNLLISVFDKSIYFNKLPMQIKFNCENIHFRTEFCKKCEFLCNLLSAVELNMKDVKFDSSTFQELEKNLKETKDLDCDLRFYFKCIQDTRQALIEVDSTCHTVMENQFSSFNERLEIISRGLSERGKCLSSAIQCWKEYLHLEKTLQKSFKEILNSIQFPLDGYTDSQQANDCLNRANEANDLIKVCHQEIETFDQKSKKLNELLDAFDNFDSTSVKDSFNNIQKEYSQCSSKVTDCIQNLEKQYNFWKKMDLVFLWVDELYSTMNDFIQTFSEKDQTQNVLSRQKKLYTVMKNEELETLIDISQELPDSQKKHALEVLQQKINTIHQALNIWSKSWQEELQRTVLQNEEFNSVVKEISVWLLNIKSKFSHIFHDNTLDFDFLVPLSHFLISQEELFRRQNQNTASNEHNAVSTSIKQYCKNIFRIAETFLILLLLLFGVVFIFLLSREGSTFQVSEGFGILLIPTFSHRNGPPPV